MPPLQGFSNNGFRNREDLEQACIALLQKLRPYQSDGGARIKLPLATGTHFDDTAAQLEGFARPLWAIGSLIHNDDSEGIENLELIQPYIRGLANGTDPSHPEYWGPVVLRDQRMVEMEIISFALLAAPGAMYHRQTQKTKTNIATWLNTLNGKDFPVTNWLWFRVMTNLALVKVCGYPYEELKQFIDSDLDLMEQFYLDEGWAADGIWSENGRQADYYSGSFAIQFSQLLYIRMAEDLDPSRCAKFRARAAAFATSFWRYFDSNGAAIPFGRSLTYRYAFAGFWSAVAFAKVELPEPLNDLGIVKGLLLRHFRWWANKDDAFNVDGTLTIGFAFPNMYMGEDYNSPQSPYWSMKSFVALGLPASDPFWAIEEKHLPPFGPSLSVAIKPPSQIVCSTGNHHFLLSAGQFCPWPLKATEAKYCKFAYSSAFGFSVPTGASVIAQIAPDSTLALSKDDGDTWRVPWKLQGYGFREAAVVQSNIGVVETIPALYGVWRPWKDADVEVSTILLPPSRRWPDWSVRIHTIKSKNGFSRPIRATVGGFAIQGRGAKFGEVLPSFDHDTGNFMASFDKFSEGTLQTPDSSIIASDAGVSGIRDIPIATQGHTQANLSTKGVVLKPDANTNLIWQRTLIPTLELKVEIPSAGNVACFAIGVFAISRTSETWAAYEQLDVKSKWEDTPCISCGGTDAPGSEYYINCEST